MKEIVVTEELQGTQIHLSETQPKFHGENCFFKSLYFSAMPPYCSVPSPGSKRA
jgi:hypothetical protein